MWWLPDAPEDRVPGVLTYDPEDGMHLDLIGGWKPRELVKQENGELHTVATDKADAWPIIHGVGDNKLVTVLDSFGNGSYTFGGITIGSSEIPTKMRLVTNGILVGYHLKDADDAVFEAADTTVENLTWWTRRSGITYTFWTKPDADKIGQIELTRTEPLTVDIGDVRAKLSTVPWLPYAEHTRAQSLARVREHASVEFSSAEPRPLSDWLTCIGGVSDLLSLATLRPCGHLTARVYLPAAPELYSENHPQRNHRREVLVFQRHIVKPAADDPGVDLRDFLFTLDDLPFDGVLPRWFELRDKFRTAIGIVLGLSAITGGYLETRVMSSVAAAESFHRQLGTPKPLNGRQHRELLKSLRDATPEDLRAWVGMRLPRNDPTLRERLIELCSRIEAPATALIPDREKWADAAKDARNKLAHTGASEQHTNDALNAVAEVTAALVLLNVLHELGVPDDSLTQSITRHSSFRYAARLAYEHFRTPTSDDGSGV